MKPKPPSPKENQRWEYPLRLATWVQEQLRHRIEASRKLFGHPFFRGDCHCHSVFSDGIGTVAEMHAMKQAAGLDFLFVTDHWTVAQKRETARFRNVWWGQEPPTQFHHLGILDNPRTCRMRGDLRADFAAARRLGRLVFIAHPTGWYPTTRYRREQMDSLFDLADEFHLEIINGANQFFDCFDETDAGAVALWDRLLCAGKRVGALGNSDAHLPHAIGSVWNGVFAARLNKTAILQALGDGRNFVSEAPLIHFDVTAGKGRAGAGQCLPARARQAVLRYRAADSLGLSRVRIVQDGQVVGETDPEGAPRDDGTIHLTVGQDSRYVRVECQARDMRRAYSNPVYFL